MKKIRRINILVICLAFVALLFTFNFSVNVNASEKKFSNYAATYRVKETKDERDLGYGVHYRREKATLSIDKPNVKDYCSSKAAGSDGGDYVEQYKEYGQQVNVLEIANRTDVELVPYAVLEGGGWFASSVMNAAEHYETTHPGQRVIAAVNGDFFQISKDMKASTGATVGQGEFYKANSQHGSSQNIGIKNTGTGKQLKTINAYDSQLIPTITFYDEKGNEVYKVKGQIGADLTYNKKGVKVNAEPDNGEVAFYYAQVNKAFYSDFTKRDAKDVWLFDNQEGGTAVTVMDGSFYGKGKATSFVKGDTKIGEGQFAIKSKNAEVNKYLKEGALVRCQYEFSGPNSEFTSAIGFPFKIMENNEAYVNDTVRHPRTMIGQKADGTVVLSVVDGRQRSKQMYGATCIEMAAIMGYYGCVDAWNLDGGGSSTLLVRKQNNWVFKDAYNEEQHLQDNWYVTNSPSDGSERRDGNCLLIVTKVPEVKLSVNDITSNSVKINVAQLTTMEKYKDLYVVIEDKSFKINADGTVTGTGLKDNKLYTAFLYAKVGDEMYNLMSEVTFVTCYKYIENIQLDLSIRNRKGQDYVYVIFNTETRDGIENIYFLIGEKRYGTSEDSIYVDESILTFDSFRDIDVNIVFKGSSIKESELLTFEDVKVNYNTEYVMHEIIYRNNSIMDQLFASPIE